MNVKQIVWVVALLVVGYVVGVKFPSYGQTALSKVGV